MGSRGPVKKPTALRLAEGNPGKVAIQQEIKPPPITPKRPSWITGDARKEWEFIVPHLERLGLITAIDGTALALYCLSFGRWREAEKQIQKEGTTYKTSRGTVQKHPAVAVSKQYFEQMKQMLSEFGLTPQARARMSVSGDDSDDSGAAFFGY